MQFAKIGQKDFCSLRTRDGPLPPEEYGADRTPAKLKRKGRVVLSGDNITDDTRCQAVFTELGASASQMTAGHVLDTTSRLPGMTGEAKLRSQHVKEAPKLLELQPTECTTIGTRRPRTRRPANQDKINRTVVALENNVHGHPSASLLWQRKLEMEKQEIEEEIKLGMLVISSKSRNVLLKKC